MIKAMRNIFIAATALALSGCLAKQLKELDIEQRRAELAEIADATAFVAGQPSLGSGYDARLFVAENSLNSFLAGMDNYEIPLESPRRASIVLKQTRLSFLDGKSLVQVEALGRRKGWPVEIKLRLLAQLVVTPDPQAGTLRFTFRIKRILPDVKLSIFRLREYLFAQSLMRVPAQKYVDALPAIEVPLKPEFALTMKSQSDSWVEAGKGQIKLRVNNPAFNKRYRYTPIRVLPLEDGLHLMLRLEEAL